MLSIEPVLARAGGRAAAYVGRKALDGVQRKRLAAQVRPLVSHITLTSFIDDLAPSQATRFAAFLGSPQFDHLALQMMSWRLTGRSEDFLADLRDGVRRSLRSRVELADEQLVTGADLVLQLLVVAVEAAAPSTLPTTSGALPKSALVSIAADIAAASARSNELLDRLPSLRAVDGFSSTMRSQVLRMRSKMRLTHLGNRSAVDYARLHVDPRFRRPNRDDVLTMSEVLAERQRVVVLGDPGAGKSTLAAKLAHDIADDAIPGMEGRVPFLLIVRDLAEVVRTQRRPLAAMLETAAAHPYNVAAPADAVEYLLLNGLAVVIVDGLDEFGDQAARLGLSELIEGFAHLYPTVNVVVTSRRVGYADAPLDTDMFSECHIAPFDDDQVERYASNWFRLDADEPSSEHAELEASFLRASLQVADLRSNPLMLSLLCSLYSSKRAIPHRRTEIYEQCAELLFDGWDRHRGIAVPLGFTSHMRPAVARLAWMMYNDHTHGQVVSRERITEFLIEYMMEVRFDNEVEAAAAVEEFLDFCSGRAWVLTKVGTEGHRPVYGFTHRTFLEYFAAVQLVRMAPSAPEVWRRLELRISDSSWQVVAHLSVQLLERSAEDGASELIDQLLKAAVASSDRPALLLFAAEVAGQTALRPAVLRQLALECVRLAGEQSTHNRFRYFWDTRALAGMRALDAPLATLLALDLPETGKRRGPLIVDAVLNGGFDLADDSLSYGWLLGLMTTDLPVFDPVREAIRESVHTGGLSVKTLRWAVDLNAPSAEAISRYGASFLYKESIFDSQIRLSHAATLLVDTILNPLATNPNRSAMACTLAEEIYEPLVTDHWPWLRARNSERDITSAPGQESTFIIANLDHSRFLALNRTQRSTALLLLLPFMQQAVVDDKNPPAGAELFVGLLAARRSGRHRRAAIERLGQWALRTRAHELVLSWIMNETSPILRYS